MGDEQAAGQPVGQLANDRFARKTVKPVPLNSLRSKRFRNGQRARHVGHGRMEGCVEACHLLDAGEVFLCKPYDGQRRRHVQRRVGRRGLQFAQDRIVDAAMTTQLRTAMDDAVPDGGRRG
jgi:hypothetical protein